MASSSSFHDNGNIIVKQLHHKQHQRDTQFSSAEQGKMFNHDYRHVNSLFASVCVYVCVSVYVCV